MTQYACRICKCPFTELQASYFTVCLSCADGYLRTSAQTVKKPVILNARGERYKISTWDARCRKRAFPGT